MCALMAPAVSAAKLAAQIMEVVSFRRLMRARRRADATASARRYAAALKNIAAVMTIAAQPCDVSRSPGPRARRGHDEAARFCSTDRMSRGRRRRPRAASNRRGLRRRSTAWSCLDRSGQLPWSPAASIAVGDHYFLVLPEWRHRAAQRRYASCSIAEEAHHAERKLSTSAPRPGPASDRAAS